MTPSEREVIESFLDALLRNRPIDPLQDPADLEGIQDRLLRLSLMLQELKQFAVRLAAGDVDAPAPPRSNYLAAGLKQLQAQMMHLTWQTQRVAEGDYGQQVDFMGDFATAFNTMVDQLRNREASLREQQEVMEKIFNMIEPILVIKADDSSEILFANEMAVKRFGVMVNRCTSPTVVLEEIVNLTPGNTEHQVYDQENGRWYGVTVRTLLWGDQHEAKLCYCRDITGHKERENTLDIVANTDELTGIKNRRAFDHAYLRLWNACVEAGKPISLIMFDLDHFKRFNDTYGHMEGDVILKSFADVLRSCIARNDDLIARYGGEEFIAALPFTNQESAIRIAQTVCDTTEQCAFQVCDKEGIQQTVRISVSGGVSTIVPTIEVRPSQLIQSADYGLYRAKQTGRNRIFYQALDEMPIPKKTGTAE